MATPTNNITNEPPTIPPTNAVLFEDFSAYFANIVLFIYFKKMKRNTFGVKLGNASSRKQIRWKLKCILELEAVDASTDDGGSDGDGEGISLKNLLVS